MEEKGKLGLVACIAIIIGGCIGSAIFSLSGMTMYYAGPSAIISWAVAGVILMLYGMQVAELSVRYPKSGGTFVFPQKAFGATNPKRGDMIGFLSSWGYSVSNVIAVAFSAIYVATYLGAGFPALSGLQIPLALISVAVCLILNLMKITDAGKANNIIVAALAITMIIFGCVACFGGTFDPTKFTPFFTQGIRGSTGWISAIPVASVAYGSCVSIAFMVSEVKNPNRTVPKSLIIGLIVVIVLYLFLMVGTLGNLDVAILKDDNNAFFRYVPMFAALWTSALGQYAWLAKLVSIAALLALITTMLVVMAINARSIQAMADGGYLPKGLAKTNKNGVPGNATILVAIAAALLSCKPAWTEILVGLGALFAVVTIIITCASLLKARTLAKLEPHQYRAPLGPILPLVTIVALTLCYIPDIIGGDWKLWTFTAIIYGIGLVIFFIGASKKYKQ